MFRPIRRKNKEINLNEVKKLLLEARRGILAVNGDDGYPYAIPINYCYDEEKQKIYFHGSRVGHKVDALKKCDKICFTVFGPEIVKAEEWAPFVQSVVVFGRCHLLDNSLESEILLKNIAKKYYPNEELIDKEISISGRNVQLYEIEIEHYSGKEIQER